VVARYSGNENVSQSIRTAQEAVKFVRISGCEDEVRLARQIASALIEAGHDPVVTHDGEAALRDAAKSSFD